MRDTHRTAPAAESTGSFQMMTDFGPQLQSLHRELAELAFVPGWNRPGNPPMWPAPRPSFQAAHWTYAQAHRALAEAGELVDTALAERRNLIAVNPAPGNTYPTLRTIVVAYQMMLPGERARVHRHSPHAGRLVLDTDEGAYTVVDGVQLPMRPGDVVLTPSWRWHGHGHDGALPAYWIDFLDIPLVQLMEPMFFEPHPQDWIDVQSQTRESPLLFPYEQVSARLDETAPDPTGVRGRTVTLETAGTMPTIGLEMRRFDARTSTVEQRTTANYEYCVVEGAGSTWVGDERIEWSRGDVVAIPGWVPHRHETPQGATVLVISDEPLQRFCGYYRTADLADGGHTDLETAGRP